MIGDVLIYFIACLIIMHWLDKHHDHAPIEGE